MLLTVIGAVAVAGGSDVVLDALLQRPKADNGVVVVPDHFLRSWDPITVFFPNAQGPAGGGAEHAPDKLVTLDPDWPGAWTWLDGRTLQFRPAEPYPPLDVVTVAVRNQGRPTALATLMAPPIRSTPSNGATDLEAVERVTLTFPQPVDPVSLARMVTIDVQPLAGIGRGPAQHLTSRDYEVKVLDQLSRDDPARYALVLHHPIALGQRATVRFGLSLDDTDEAVSQLAFSTAAPFRVETLGCSNQTMPMGPDGVAFPSDKPIRCGSVVEVSFTSIPAEIGPIEGRNLVRFEPAVDDLEFALSGRVLRVSGAFRPDVPYRVSIAATEPRLRDRSDRPLELRGEGVVWVYFPRRDPFLRWGKGQGIAERRGPIRIPIEGRGHGRADLRIHKVDPLNRNLWPFPSGPVVVDESSRPPGPGETPDPWEAVTPLSSSDLIRRLASLGSPGISQIVDLPLDADAGAASVGLDVAPYLTRLSGSGAPGHYLLGMRRLDGGSERAWVRVQVTDLSLTTVENPRDTVFAVSSLASGQPVSGARVRVEGSIRSNGTTAWGTLFEGKADAAGLVTWNAPGPDRNRSVSVGRVTVTQGNDVLVLSPGRADTFRDGRWSPGSSSWLGWMFGSLEKRGEADRVLAHLFVDRPVYRPGDEVNLKGYIRQWSAGRLSRLGGMAEIVVRAPGGTTWRLPAEITGTGSVFSPWQVDEPPTGTYTATLFVEVDGRQQAVASSPFQVEAYRLPTFEVDLHPPDGQTEVAGDRPFDVALTASYYAGGRVAARPVRWRVTQFPYSWTPADRPGFVWSTSGRYGTAGTFRATPALSLDASTSGNGQATLTLDPSIEADARPRTYVVEATVTGADDQTVTETMKVHAVPAFVLGLKVPRYLEDASRIRAEVLAVGPTGEPLADQELVVRLIQRQWHSVLQASDFSNGEARYLTDVVEALETEKTLTSRGAPQTVDLPIDEAGVYLVEVEARDRLGRVQVVRVDLFAGGSGDVSWDKPEAGTFTLTSDASSYAPGDRARVVIQSPFQKADALIVLETPEGNRYERIPVRGGKGVYSVSVEPGWVPHIPVHVVLRRGRSDSMGTANGIDLDKPQTVASTLKLAIDPVENQLDVTLIHPERALPGETIPMTVRLTRPDGSPTAGEVTLWLVDQAVLALAEEQRLDPLPDFVHAPRSHVAIRDTRNWAYGRVPTKIMPGGDGGEERMEEADLLEQTTIRKDFRPIAYYAPSLTIGPSGSKTVQIALPDNLTVFKVRAKAIAGLERFGVGTSQVAVRLPVVMQPAFPRFVRPGDTFEAVGIARVVEGPGGPGTVQFASEALQILDDTTNRITLDPQQATRIGFSVTVPGTDPTDAESTGDRTVTLKMGVARSADGAADAIEVTLPVRPDRLPRTARTVIPLANGGQSSVPALADGARPGSVRRTVVVADHPGIVQLAGALDRLRGTHPRSTAERIAQGRMLLGLGGLREPLGLAEASEVAELDQRVRETQAWLGTVLDGGGRVAHWPGGTGRVGLTAEALLFLLEAREAGFGVDGALVDTLTRTLQSGLRSDYRYFLDGESWLERTMALLALTRTDRFEDAYFAELARNTRNLGPEGTARVLLAAHHGGQADTAAGRSLTKRLSDEIVIQLYQGEERYGGLASVSSRRNPLIAPSEAATLAHVLRGLQHTAPTDRKLPLSVDALVRMGGADGWGHAGVDAAVTLALADRLSASPTADARVRILDAGQPEVLSLDPSRPVQRYTTTSTGALSLKHEDGGSAVALAVDRWVPAPDGSTQAPEQQGFVVSRGWQRIRGAGPSDKIALDTAGQVLPLQIGDVVEEHVQLVCPESRHYVVVTVPLAAGMEPLNPALATSGPEARPTGRATASPSWVAFYDDAVHYAFETLPKGTFDLYFRTRASVEGAFVQPAAQAQMIYDPSVLGLSAGAKVTITAADP